jgi:hypothetical protein
MAFCGADGVGRHRMWPQEDEGAVGNGAAGVYASEKYQPFEAFG